MLSTVAESQPQAAYSAFVTGFKNKLSYFMRTIPNFILFFFNRTAYRSNEARLDVRARNFWERGQQVFFDLRVFDPNSCRYLHKSVQHCHTINENEKNKVIQ